MRSVLTVATLGMSAYGTYSTAWAIVDLLRGASVDIWAEVVIAFFGVLLVVAAAFVRVRIPGGLAMAIGAMLGLQAMAVYTSSHLGGGLAPQIGRGVLAFFLVGTAVAEEGRARPGGGRRS
jgi:hypothetical protein